MRMMRWQSEYKVEKSTPRSSGGRTEDDSHSANRDGGDGPGPRLRGWTFMDFYEDPIKSSIVPLLVEGNFKGRKSGEEGWL